MIIGCNIRMICLEFFYGLIKYCNFLNLYERYILQYELVLTCKATDRSKISSNHHRIFFDISLYPLLFFGCESGIANLALTLTVPYSNNKIIVFWDTLLE